MPSHCYFQSCYLFIYYYYFVYGNKMLRDYVSRLFFFLIFRKRCRSVGRTALVFLRLASATLLLGGRRPCDEARPRGQGAPWQRRHLRPVAGSFACLVDKSRLKYFYIISPGPTAIKCIQYYAVYVHIEYYMHTRNIESPRLADRWSLGWAFSHGVSTVKSKKKKK